MKGSWGFLGGRHVAGERPGVEAGLHGGEHCAFPHLEASTASGFGLASSLSPVVSGVAREGLLIGESRAGRVRGTVLQRGACDWALFWPGWS